MGRGAGGGSGTLGSSRLGARSPMLRCGQSHLVKRAPHRTVTIRGKWPFDGPLMAARRFHGRHIKQSLSPNQGRGEMGRGEGGSGTLVRVGGGGGAPLPK